VGLGLETTWGDDASSRVGLVPAVRLSITLTLILSVLSAWPRYQVVGSADAGQYNLEITDAELSDDASYECQATEAALRSRRAKLTVLSNDSMPHSATRPCLSHSPIPSLISWS
jgi:hypothetical protein